MKPTVYLVTETLQLHEKRRAKVLTDRRLLAPWEITLLEILRGCTPEIQLHAVDAAGKACVDDLVKRAEEMIGGDQSGLRSELETAIHAKIQKSMSQDEDFSIETKATQP